MSKTSQSSTVNLKSSEAELYKLLRTAPWRPTIISVGHRGTLRSFHDQLLEISAFYGETLLAGLPE